MSKHAASEKSPKMISRYEHQSPASGRRLPGLANLLPTFKPKFRPPPRAPAQSYGLQCSQELRRVKGPTVTVPT
ncbi:unnamed protein product [Parajaminaea phylloscopi]